VQKRLQRAAEGLRAGMAKALAVVCRGGAVRMLGWSSRAVTTPWCSRARA